MKLRKFKQDKLWRDKAVDRLEQAGSKIHWERLDADQFAEQLKIKLLEEAAEVCSAKTKESLVEELADILEVVSSFCELHEVPLQYIIGIQHKKRLERGGFQGRKFVTVAEHPIGSFGEKYCLNDSEKYPEIIE
jgi:predicted house-cleaning noncanonical NTP pyrophosphatase (MazG superfamily)